MLRYLDRSETKEYNRSNLNYAGDHEDLFTGIAMDVIQQGPFGISRIINQICKKSLMNTSQQGNRLIVKHSVIFFMEDEMRGSVKKRIC